MTKTLRVFRLSDVGWRLLRHLASITGQNDTGALIRAIDAVHSAEVPQGARLAWHNAKRSKAVRLPLITLLQIDELRQHWGTSAAETLTLALHMAATDPASESAPASGPRAVHPSLPASEDRPDGPQGA